MTLLEEGTSSLPWVTYNLLYNQTFLGCWTKQDYVWSVSIKEKQQIQKKLLSC